jgi:hypothetical protein
MNGIVPFVYATWATRYPELSASVEEPLAQLFFNEATIYCDNTAGSLIQDDSVNGQREMILYMLTSHIAALNATINGIAPSTLVGRIASAGQGSVNVSVDNQYPPGTAQWFQQTKYGAAYWAATAQFRLFRYRRGSSRVMDAYRPF